ncbi:MAG: hypothetical protein IJD38_10230 [Clostridia bacterium]|nr:hypothetical protein [Clostridia bacterium]
MKKNEIKGLSAFELLDGLDDGMILSATLPEAAPVAAPAKRERASAFFTRMGKGGLAAAIATVAVALAVLTGVLLAGQSMGGLFPSWGEPSLETEPGPPQTRPDIDNGILYPPMNENPDQAEKSQVAVVSDGITVYPNGYCVYISEVRRNENGELEGLDGDGLGAVYQLPGIWDELPTLITAGNRYELRLPEHKSLRGVRLYTKNQTRDGFEQMEMVFSVDPMADLATLPNGDYVVVLDIYHETVYSADEYTKGLDEYAFRLTVDRTMNDTVPVRVIHGDRVYFLTGYTLQKIYYDAELQEEVTQQYDGAEKILAELAPDMVTATVPMGESLSLYLAPFYELNRVRVFDSSFRLSFEMGHDSPFDDACLWDAGDYYAVITAVYLGTGETEITEFPIHIKVVEEEEESTPAGDVGETPLPPRVSVGSSYGGLDFGNTGHSREYHEGYMLWTEQWYDGGMISGDGFGATGQLSEIADGLPTLRHNAGEEPFLRVYEDGDTLTRIYVYRDDLTFHFDTMDAHALATLPEGRYIIVLRMETQGDYVEEADAYERTCTEYAFWLDVVEPLETTPRVTVSGGGQTAAFATVEDGFKAWTERRQTPVSSLATRYDGTPAVDVIISDNDAMRALPKMEMVYGDTLTATLDAAEDELILVKLYDAKGGFITSGADLSVVNVLKNEGGDQHVIVIREVTTVVSQTELVCYEYAFELYILCP